MRNTTLKRKLLKFGRKNKYWNSGLGVWFYMEHEIFPNISFINKNFLDIGAGKGIFCAYASINGANNVVGLEPEIEGSSKGVSFQFNKIKKELQLDNISVNHSTLQEFKSLEKFDIVLMHASINHLNEEECIKLHTSKAAQDEYVRIFKHLRSLLKKGAVLIVHDCARGNFSTRIGLKRGSKFNKVIEWEKHQNPKLWAKLLSYSEFKLIKKSYKGESKYLFLSYLFKNRLMAYLRWNEFILTFEAI